MSSLLSSSSSSSSLSLAAFRWRLCLSREELANERVTAIGIEERANIYVGCESGTIITLAMDRSNTGLHAPEHSHAANSLPHQPICRMIGKRKMGKKAVQQLEVVYVRDGASTKAMLLALVDSKLLLLDSQTLNTVVEVGPKESFSLFSVDIDITPPRICAAIKNKKKLQIFALSMAKAELIKELLVPDTVLAMVAQGDMIAIGYKREYSLLSLISDAPTDVPVPVDGISPTMARCGANELLLATNNSLGFFVSFSGDPLPKAPLVWQQVPYTFAQCGGYILAAMIEPGANSKDSSTVLVAISSVMDQKQVQSVRLPNKLPPNSASSSAALILATHARTHLVVVAMLTANGSELFAFTPTSTLEQIEQYLDAGMASEAASLFATLKPTQAQSDEFSARAGWIAIRECDFAHAFDFFAHSSVDPREVIALFEDLTIKSMLWNPPSNSASTIHQLTNIVTIIEQAKSRQSNASASTRKKDSSDVVQQSTSQLIRMARIALANFLWGYRKDHLSPVKPGEEEIAVWVDTALLFLLVDHESWRIENKTEAPVTSQKGRRGSQSTSTPNDNTPITSSVEPLSYTLHQLLFPSNSCLLYESELFLSRERWYLSLAALFQSKGTLRKALEVWRNLGEGRFNAKDPPGILAGGNSNAANLGIQTKIVGLKETVALLSTLGDTPILWEFAEWVLQASPMDGLKTFLTPRAAASNPSATNDSSVTSLPPDKVLTFLTRIQTSAKLQQNQDRHGGVDDGFTVLPTNTASGTTLSQVDLVECYLEYLIQHERTKSSKYHTSLALCYLGKVIKLGLVSASGSAGARASGGRFKPGHEPGARGPPRLKLMRFLQRSEEYDPAIVLQQLVELSAKTSLDSSGARGRAGSIGTQTLTWSGPPTPTPGGPTYSGLDPTKHEANLYEELLLLLSKLGKHTRVLQIYLFDLRDELGAARYAEYICRRQSAASERRKESERRAAARALLDVNKDGASNPSAVPSSPTRGTNGSSGSGGAIEEKHPGEVFLELLEIYFSDEYAQMWRARQEQKKLEKSSSKKNVDDSGPPPQPTDAALALLNEFFPLMDPVALLRILPPTLPLASLSHLFSRLFPATLHARRHGRLVAGMHKMVHLRTQAHCFLLRSISLSLDTSAKCSWCYKALHDSVFVAHPLHCLKDPITGSFVIDFEQGGIAPAVNARPGGLAVDPFKEELGFRNELPRFVLVHYQCSAPFLANGGVDAFMGNTNANTATTTATSASNTADTRSRMTSTVGNPPSAGATGLSGQSYNNKSALPTSLSFRK